MIIAESLKREGGMEKMAKNLLTASDLSPEKIAQVSGLPLSKIKMLIH